MSICVINDYTNTLLTAFNPRTELQENIVPNPHPCSLDQNLIKEEERPQFYEAVLNCCQRHVCRPEGYCHSTKKDGCRFDYPFELCEASHIEFTETGNSVKAHIYLKRNDSYLNVHNQLILSNWCANVDMQIILDQAAAIAYMVKYATKAEKAGKSLNDLYRSVILYANDDDNVTTKLKSLMLQSLGKRDIGQCEVCRLLMSEPLYSSSFEYATQSLDLFEQSKEIYSSDNTLAISKTLMEFYAHRNQNLSSETEPDQSTFYQFVQKYI